MFFQNRFTVANKILKAYIYIYRGLVLLIFFIYLPLFLSDVMGRTEIVDETLFSWTESIYLFYCISETEIYVSGNYLLFWSVLCGI